MGKPTARSANLKRKGFTTASLQDRAYQISKKKLAGSTEKNYAQAKIFWDEFCSYIEQPSDLHDGSPVPEVQLIKHYITWWAASSVGRIQEAVNLCSAEVVWQRLQAVIFRETGNKVPRKVREDILAWIRSDLVKELNLRLEKSKKGLCDAVVYNNLVTQALCHDADEINWERNRVQMIFIIQLHLFSGGRPGAFMATSYYPDICLLYSDVEFVLMRLQDGQEKFGIVLKQKMEEGRKGKD